MPSTAPSRPLTSFLLHFLTLLGAFLLFQVQPVMSKFILPWFGGSPGVWTTCMLFFQVVLFLGYAYAHALTLIPRRWQVIIHALLVLGALACLPISPSDAWKPAGAEEPAGRILLLLLASVGLPYFVLSSTSPLVQVWFSRAIPGSSPWRLYALSNTGSLLGLLSYPFFFEPRLDVMQQTGLWSAAFLVFVLLSLACLWRDRGSQAVETEKAQEQADAPPSWSRRALWVLLPAMASIMLLATTNHVCQDVAVIPFMWVAPLSLYLITFIICFEHERWYVPALWALPAMGLLYAAAGWDGVSDAWNAMVRQHDVPASLPHFVQQVLPASLELHFVQQLIVFFLAMFLICLICHGELARLKPSNRRLTEFYLLMSGGGALGGLTVSLVAPRVFNNYLEWPLGLMAGFVIALIVLIRECRRQGRFWLPLFVMILVPALLVAGFLTKTVEPAKGGVFLQYCTARLTVFANTFAGFPLQEKIVNGGLVLVALAGVFWQYCTAWLTVLANTFKGFPPQQHMINGALALLAIEGAAAAWKWRRTWLQASAVTLLLAAACLGLFFMEDWGFTDEPRLERVRNFYGTIAVSENYDTGLETPYRTLSHGTITHGMQNLGEWSEQPTTYYGKSTGIGLALDSLKNKPGARVGVVGMGTGTVACYGQPGQTFRFYDINPDIVRLAKKHFTYLSDMEKRGAKLEVIIGDARLSLDRELPQGFDVILLDAFAGDSVPVHLLTREAFQIYKRHLRPDGIIAVHVTNTYLRLAPVIMKVADDIGMKTTRIQTDSDGDDYSTDYVMVTNNADFLAAHPTDGLDEEEAKLKVSAWTDKKHNLYRILNKK